MLRSEGTPARGAEIEEALRRIAGRSEAMRIVRERVRALAALQVAVLVRGEPGTGRTHVARLLQRAGGDGRRLRIVTASDPRVATSRETVLLEEVDAFSRAEQARWLEALRRSERREADAPVRLLASSTPEPPRSGGEGGWLPGLRERLERFTIDLPPLRDRREDVPELVRALGDRTAGTLGRGRVSWTREALRLLAEQSWPGNVRELATAVERLVAFDTGGRVGRAQVASLLREAPVGVASSRRSALERQREELARAIEDAGGNLAEVARRLRMSRGGVIYRAQKFGLLPRRAGSSGG